MARMMRHCLTMPPLALALLACHAVGAGLRPLPAEGVQLIEHDAASVVFEDVTLVAATDRWQYHPRAVGELEFVFARVGRLEAVDGFADGLLVYPGEDLSPAAERPAEPRALFRVTGLPRRSLR